MLRLMSALCLLGSLIWNASSFAESMVGVIDNHRILAHSTSERINKLYAESAKHNDIHVHVFVLYEDYKTPIETLATARVSEWIMKNQESRSHTKVAFLVIDAYHGKSWLALGHENLRTPALLETLNTINKQIIQPSLAHHDINKATLEGALALNVALEDWVAPHKPSWLMMQFLHPLKWIVGCIFLVGGLITWRKWPKRPQWDLNNPNPVREYNY